MLLVGLILNTQHSLESCSVKGVGIGFFLLPRVMTTLVTKAPRVYHLTLKGQRSKMGLTGLASGCGGAGSWAPGQHTLCLFQLVGGALTPGSQPYPQAGHAVSASMWLQLPTSPWDVGSTHVVWDRLPLFCHVR